MWKTRDFAVAELTNFLDSLRFVKRNLLQSLGVKYHTAWEDKLVVYRQSRQNEWSELIGRGSTAQTADTSW